MDRDDKGGWRKIEAYISEHSEAEFSHGICPECAKEIYKGHYKTDNLFMDRELRMIELKEKIKELEGQVARVKDNKRCKSQVASKETET